MRRSVTRDTIEICGLFCGICPSYPEKCHGCMSDFLRPGCDVCHAGFRECAKEHQVSRCCECGDYPCARLEAFRVDGKPHHLVVTENVGKMKELGLNLWLEEQIREHTCSRCGALVQWERSVCQVCGCAFLL